MQTIIHHFATPELAAAFCWGVEYSHDAEALRVKHTPGSCDTITEDRDGAAVDSGIQDYTQPQGDCEFTFIPAFPDLDANGNEIEDRSLIRTRRPA